MLASLKTHPFAVEAFFKTSVVLAFALPKEDLEPFIPPFLELDTYQDKYAFLAVALVDTVDLRPKGFPKILGRDFYLAGYRIFVRYKNQNGKRLRGLYILQSETNNRWMKLMGNALTHYKYSKVDIDYQQLGNDTLIESSNNLKLKYSQEENSPLPEHSPFESWKQARRFAGPLPFTFTFHEQSQEVLIVEGVRQNWKPSPIQVKDYSIPFLKDIGLGHGVLANAFIVENIPYYWKKAKRELWTA